MLVRPFIAVFLIGLLLSAIITPSLTILSFYKNQAEIAAKFCENKDKPVLKCNGKCYLQKQLKEATERPEDKATPELTVFMPVAINSSSEIELKSLDYLLKRARFFTIQQEEAAYHSEIFTPPKPMI